MLTIVFEMDPKIKRMFLNVDEKFAPFQSTPMCDFYRNKTVFITGSSGMVGQLIVEKLLRIDVKKIILLIRPKKGKSPTERYAEIMKGPIFGRAIQQNSNCHEKICIMEGDITENDMGLNITDQDIITNSVDIVLHIAADVNFTQTLVESLKSNVKGTMEVLKLSQRIKELKSLVYMSTAYSNCPRKEIKEIFYEPAQDPNTWIQFIEGMVDENDENFKILTQKMIEPWPNSYSYTKALCEEMVRKFGENVPTAVIRPSIIGCTYEDPLPGWTDNVNGVNGMLLGVGMGLIRILPFPSKTVVDCIPADYVSNATLAVAWATASKKPTDSHVTEVYNCVSSNENPVNLYQITEYMNDAYREFPSATAVWINRINYTTNNLVFKILTILYHVIPAMILDVIQKLRGDKISIPRIYRKIQRAINLTEYFSSMWTFRNNNMRKVYEKMSKEDQAIFPCDVKLVDWKDFHFVTCLGLQIYVVKENLANVENARVKFFRIRILHYTILFFCYAFLIYLGYRVLSSFNIF